MQINTIVILGSSVVVESVRETDKAIMVRNISGDVDNHGRSCWLPKSVLVKNIDYSYGEVIHAWTLKSSFVCRLDRNQKRALSLLC